MGPAGAAGPEGDRTVEYDREHQRGGWKELLGNRPFLLMETSGALAGAGYAVYSVSVLFLAYGLTGSLLLVGAVLFLEYGVYTATFLVAPLVDRARDKRTVLLVCYPIQAAAAAGLALALRFGELSVPLLLALVLVLSILWDLVWVVFMIAPRIVVETRQLFVADGLASVLSVGSTVGGYAGGGALLYFVGPYGGASAYAVLLAAALVAALPVSLRIAPAARERLWESFVRGWDAFRGDTGRAMRRLAAVEAFSGIFVAIPVLIVTAIAYQRFSHPAAVYGALATAFTLGGSFAGIAVGHFNPRRSVGWLLAVSPVVAGVGLLALAVAPPSELLLGGILAGVSAALAARFTAKYSWVRAVSTPEALGRLTANLYLFTGVAGAAAVALAGAFAGRLTLTDLELFDGIGLVAAGVIVVGLRPLRTLSY